jgi:hypothetical protein
MMSSVVSSGNLHTFISFDLWERVAAGGWWSHWRG